MNTYIYQLTFMLLIAATGLICVGIVWYRSLQTGCTNFLMKVQSATNISQQKQPYTVRDSSLPLYNLATHLQETHKMTVISNKGSEFCSGMNMLIQNFGCIVTFEYMTQTYQAKRIFIASDRAYCVIYDNYYGTECKAFLPRNVTAFHIFEGVRVV